MRRAFVIMLIFLMLIVPVHAESVETYAFVHTDEGRFSEVLAVGNSIYVLFDTSIYAYNTTTHEFTRKFDIGLNYIGVDFAYNNGSFYIAGYQVKRHISGGGNEPVITCPIPTDKNFDIFNFTIWQTNKDFGIEKTITLSKELYGGDYQTAINAMHVVFGNTLVVAVTGYNKDNLTKIESYVYEVNLSTGAFVQKLNFTERINDIVFYNSTYYINLGGKRINMYDENFTLIKSFSDTVNGMYFVSMDVSEGRAYLVGHALNSDGSIGAVFEILTADLSADIFYLYYNATEQFNAVKHYGNYTYVVGNNNMVYIFNAENKLIGNYKNDMSHAYDLYKSDYISVKNSPVPLKITVFKSASKDDIVMWGGYYITDYGVTYAYLISTDKPANWLPYSSGTGFLPSQVGNIWEQYKYYILLGGGLLVLLILSGGGKHE